MLNGEIIWLARNSSLTKDLHAFWIDGLFYSIFVFSTV